MIFDKNLNNHKTVVTAGVVVCRQVFKLKGKGGAEYKIGFAVVETTDDAVIMDRKVGRRTLT